MVFRSRIQVETSRNLENDSIVKVNGLRPGHNVFL
jgi:hypothetical protein